MGCGEPPTPGSLLSTCREPRSPHLIAVKEPDERFDEHAQRVLSLSTNQIGAVSEAAAERFLKRQFGLEPQGRHSINAQGIDHLTVSTAGMIVVAETKGTAGVGKATQAAYRSSRAESFRSLTGPHQASPAWINKDASLREAGLDSSHVSGVIGARVDTLSQSIDVWERNHETGGWDFVGSWHCATADLVNAAVGA